MSNKTEKLAAAALAEALTATSKANGVSRELDDKADIDGDYEGLTAGHSLLSENLDSNIKIADKTLYSFRTTAGGEEVAARCYEKSIVGGDVAVNQKCPAITGNTYATTNTDLVSTSILSNVFDNTSTHIWLFIFRFSAVSANCKVRIRYPFLSPDYTSAGTKYAIKNTLNSDDLRIQYKSTDGEEASVTFPNDWFDAIDLTQMFGSATANYIFTLEQNEGGSGLAWIRSYGFLTKDHYAYNTGSLLSVKTSGKKVSGFNLYNSTSGTAKLIGGQQCQITGTYTLLAYEDINGNAETITPDGNGKFTPTNDGTLSVMGGNATDTCVHFVWDGERDGEFEPYEATTYACDNIDLHGIVKKDTSNNLYYDGDEYASDGTVTRKYGVLVEQTGAIGDTITLTGFDTNATDIITSAGHLADVGTISGDVLTLDAALTDAVIVYPLATPTTESATAFTEYQKCDNWGTEEWLDGRTEEMPAGHNTDYLPDLKAKLETAPENPSLDGYYVMKRDGGANAYYSLSSWLSANGYKASVIPAPPAEDGAYTLTVAVADGTATYSWEA